MKLISNPYECGYTDQEPNWRDVHCRHPKTDGELICDNSMVFPKNCPLPNGKLIPKTIAEIIKMMESELKELENLQNLRK